MRKGMPRMPSLLVELIDPKMVAVLRVFLEQKDKLFHLQKVSRVSGVSLGTTFRLVHRMARLEILEIEKIGEFKLYRLGRSKEIKALEVLHA